MSKIITVLIGVLLLLVVAGPAWAQDVAPQHTDPGWQAVYFNNTSLAGPPVLQRSEGNLAHNWGQGFPGPGVSYDQFSARWTRYIEVTPGTYQVTVTADDGIRLWVDDDLLIDQWRDQSAATYTASKYLGPGHHLVRVEYYENFGDAVVEVSWSQAGPPPRPTPPPPPGSGAWRGEYFNNVSLSGPPVLVRDDSQIGFNWGGGSPAPGLVNADHFSARWSRNLNLSPGQYRFTLTVDDGARLFVSGHLLIDAWQEQSPTAYSGEIYLPGGTVSAQLEYYERGGGAVAQLSWTAVSNPPPPSGPTGYVTAYRLNVRSGPGLSYPAVGSLSRGQEVRLLGRDWPGRWVIIDAPGNLRGWVSARYVRSTVPLYQLPIVQSAAGGER
ncbi:MAG TPA: PA14 domain-containing protein [Anaerolineae bacterium]|nr:PA14 domain-containing protein [Anaerolineae bacterium]